MKGVEFWKGVQLFKNRTLIDTYINAESLKNIAWTRTRWMSITALSEYQKIALTKILLKIEVNTHLVDM